MPLTGAKQGKIKFILGTKDKALVQETTYGESTYDRFKFIKCATTNAISLEDKANDEVVYYDYDAASASNDGKDVTFRV